MKKLFTLLSFALIIHGTSFSSEKDNNNFFGVPEGAPFKLIDEARSKMEMRDLSPEEKEAMKEAYDMELQKRGFDKEGLTPLIRAIKKEKNKIKVVANFLANGASVNAGDFLDFTPLHYAAAEGDIEMINILSNYKPNVNAQGANGKTPLHWAKDGKTVQCLLSLGALILKDNGFMTPLFSKISLNETDAARELILSGKEDVNAIAGRHSLLTLAVRLGNEVIVRRLIDAGASVNKANNHKETPLFCAVDAFRYESGSCNLVKLLLFNGADVNGGIVKGTTPLHLAAQIKNENLFQLLCKAGADTNIKDEDNKTPSDYYPPIFSKKFMY
ncbi:MAG: ankyrin repeat domain-containing protein [Candidatus Babeliales bacterium]